MARYYLIGGHDHNLKSNYIFENMLRLSKKKSPRILFLPTATNDELESFEKFRGYFDNHIAIDYLLLTKCLNIDDAILKLNDYDILYINGGNTIKLLQFLHSTGFDRFFIEASRKDILIAGISAGAMLYTKLGMADAYSYYDNFNFYNYKEVRCLGILDFSLCPHFEKNDRILFYRDLIKNNNIDVAYALTDDSALYIDGNNIKYFSAKKALGIYRYRKDNDYLMENIESKKLSVLGPSGTFSEIAAYKLENSLNERFDIKMYSTIRDAFKGVEDTGLGLIPFENTLDGYVAEVLDLLHQSDYSILGEINIPVSFSFISKAESIEDVKKVYTQFKAKGQCLDFLSSKGFEVIETESNSRSYALVKNSGKTYGAIVPRHLVERDFSLVIDDVTDNKNNFTRFILVSKTKREDYIGSKTSLILDANDDKPGILMEALMMFKEYNININSIMSRPTKQGLGSYYFYLELEALDGIDVINEIIENINKNKMFKARSLGFYSKLED